MHAERWRKHGDPLVGAKPTRKQCSQPGCAKVARGRGLCGTHWLRWRKYGDPSVTLRPYGEYRRVTAAGYVMVYDPSHPLAQSNGYVPEHRKVMHDAGIDLTGVHVHHIDGDKQNNDLSNLLVLGNADHGRIHGMEPTVNGYGVWAPTKGRTCSVEGCREPVLHRDWCCAHYNRWRRHGDPLAGRWRSA